MKKNTTTKAQVQTPEFDPNKLYRWSETDTFSFLGREFGFLFNAIRLDKQKLMMQLELINLMEAKLKEAVESGVAKEESPQPEADASKSS